MPSQATSSLKERIKFYGKSTMRGPMDEGPVSLSMRVLGVLCLVAGLILLAISSEAFVGLIGHFLAGAYESEGPSTEIVMVLRALLLLALSAFLASIGLALAYGRRRLAASLTHAALLAILVAAICDVMVEGITWRLIPLVGAQLLAVVAQALIDPTLGEERRVQRELRKLELRDEADEGVLGRDPSGKGYIRLDFFNLFWIFVTASVLGLLFENTFHELYYHGYQNRAGLLFGPFSPIYGLGAVLMTVALNRFHKGSVLVVFLASALIGGVFEYLASWFMELAFGVTAWDYTGMWLSIGGRTCGFYMAIWGVLGLLWIKLLLPLVLRVVNLIPWEWRYAVTGICAMLMLVDVVMTLQALDCWYERVSGMPVSSNVQQFYAAHFDDSYMQHRFQSMLIQPDAAARG